MSSPSSSETPNANPTVHGLPALERLRERIEAAAAEIERLRAANAALAERVQELAAQEVARTDGSAPPLLTLEGDPADLRAKIESFIEAIDQMLAEPDDQSDAGGVPDEPAPESTA